MSTTQHTSTQRFLALDLDNDGAHPAAWRASSHTPGELLSGDRIRGLVRDAEAAGFHAATFSDGPLPAIGPDVPGRLDALQRAAFAAPLTRRIALAPVVDVVFTEPFHVATQLATLDHVSYGRAGWIISASGAAAEGAAVGRHEVTGEALQQEASDVVEANRRLWDSWEDDAVIRDVAAGRYLDSTQLHYADFAGATFTVKGPSIVPRPPQGQLPVIAPVGLVPVREVDAVLVGAGTPDQLVETAEAARAAGARAVIAELEVVLDARGRSGLDRLAELDAHTAWTSHRTRFVGSAADLVDRAAELFTVVDGIRILPAVLDVELPELHHAVLPMLRARRLLATQPADTTFRSLLGLDRPANRYTTDRLIPA
ncbi:LLM class flavin-dependent oxidoreductase [Kocuria arenosa]|uniref:LLM class flavin-dependent oxidoreductase n=1 Tax=Kocuria arenosa TaxID=3071446 RepID=UPI0034D65CF1